MTRSGCRSCGGTWEVFLDLGETPLANALPLAGDTKVEDRFPLAVARCAACSLVQITETVPPERLFGEYLYFSFFSTTMLEHAASLAERMIAERSLGPESLVVEIASNDGYLLKSYLKAGVPVLGIEPARNIAKVAVENGVPTENAFFDRAVGERIAARGKRAGLVHSHNVLAHVADLNGVVAGVAALLAPGGVWLNESPYLLDMIEKVEFDTIYHEHLCYFSATALVPLLARHGLALLDVERLSIHGGTLRFFAGHAAGGAAPSPRVAALLAEEQAWGVSRPDPYAGFARDIERLKKDLLALLASLKKEGKRIAAYGASAKGSTLLNTFGIGAENLEFVADRSPHKQGRRMPGVRVPIAGPEALLERRPDYVLLLTWNFADEILAQQSDFRAAGGKFIVPIPTPKIL